MHIHTQRFAQQTILQTEGPIRRTVSLPLAGEILVRVGQDVEAGQTLARASQPSGYTVLNVAQELGVEATDAADLMLVKLGSAVKKGRPLARKKSVMGVRTLTAPVDGTLAALRHGRLILTHAPSWTAIQAPFAGVVTAAKQQRHVTISAEGSLLQAMWGAGGQGHGTLIIATPSPATVLEAHALEHLMPGDVVVAGLIDDTTLLERMMALGVGAIIAGSMPWAVCQWAKARRLALVLTDGIGRQGMAPHFYAELEAHTGDVVGVDTTATDRRPEIVIPHEKTLGGNMATHSAEWVRVLQMPHHSTVGLLQRVQPRQGATVALAQGQQLLVPLANIDHLVPASTFKDA